jgi:hypothetical protein
MTVILKNVPIQKMTFRDGKVKFTRKVVDGQSRTIDQINTDGVAGFKEGRPGDIYTYLNNGMLVSAPVVAWASNNTQADNIKKILADYEHNLGTGVLDYQ